MSDTAMTHPAPHRDKVSFWALMFGCCAAPLFWTGQLLLGYWVSAQTCYGSDHPTVTTSPATLHAVFLIFDGVAIFAALAGGVVAYWCWRRTQEEKKGGANRALHVGDGRARFMALWGMLASAWFLIAIVFETIGSTVVPLCTP